jgi:hypothetical protein
MQKNPVISPIRIDLSDKTSDEITEFLQALLAARYSLYKKGFKLKITRLRPAKVKITPA